VSLKLHDSHDHCQLLEYLQHSEAGLKAGSEGCFPVSKMVEKAVEKMAERMVERVVERMGENEER
jgi:hypothetical protein